MGNYYSYMRISTNEERSIQKYTRQERALQKFAKEHKIEYWKEFKDDASGSSFNRKEWKKLVLVKLLVTLCSEIMLYIETPLVSYSYSLNEVSHSCTS